MTHETNENYQIVHKFEFKITGIRKTNTLSINYISFGRWHN